MTVESDQANPHALRWFVRGTCRPPEGLRLCDRPPEDHFYLSRRPRRHGDRRQQFYPEGQGGGLLRERDDGRQDGDIGKGSSKVCEDAREGERHEQLDRV